MADAPVPHAFVIPDPLSQTLNSILLLFKILAKLTLILSGNKGFFSIVGPIFFKFIFLKFFTKKTMCGFPTLIKKGSI